MASPKPVSSSFMHGSQLHPLSTHLTVYFAMNKCKKLDKSGFLGEVKALVVHFPAMHSSADRLFADTRIEGNLRGWSEFACATDTSRVCRQV